jgi:hypothetical protein
MVDYWLKMSNCQNVSGTINSGFGHEMDTGNLLHYLSVVTPVKGTQNTNGKIAWAS